MKKKIKKIGVLTSGGDAPGMNAAVRAIVRTALAYGTEVYGVYRGYDGLISGDITKLESKDVSGIIQRGGTILQSARSSEFRTPEGRAKAYEYIQKLGIEALITIGGDGTFTGANILNQEYGVRVMGIPGTIDNDLYGTDMTIGYDTAMNTVVKAVDKIRDTAGSHNRLFFIEVMGRDAGFIALNTGIATGAEDILIPETKTYLDDLILTLKQNKRRGKTSGIIIVAEGDDLGGAYDVAKKVKQHDSSYSTRVTVLGHIQRGGAPSVQDRVLASYLGYHAVLGLYKGLSHHMVGRINGKVSFTDLASSVKCNNEIDKNMLSLARILSV